MDVNGYYINMANGVVANSYNSWENPMTLIFNTPFFAWSLHEMWFHSLHPPWFRLGGVWY